MSVPVDLVWLGAAEDAPPWSRGSVSCAGFLPANVAEALDRLLVGGSSPPWILFWGPSAGSVPVADMLDRLLGQPGDVFHAGLALGMGGLPRIIDFVAPTWMLNGDPDATIEATSWRLSLAACLVRTDALRQLGGVRADFHTIAGAGLELGHRLISRGAFVRHVPSLLGSSGPSPSRSVDLPLEDELRFVALRFGRRWARWALARAILSGAAGTAEGLRAARRTANLRKQREPAYRRPVPESVSLSQADRVTVLIPTLDRYPYLRMLLDQLRRQTVRPLEIIVVDQTARDRRDTELARDFADLPLRLLQQDEPGQCSSRNAGLALARGETVLFIDDDDEVPPDLIEAHLRNLHQFRAEVSSGVADEVGAGPLPESFTFTRASDVFPTNNTLARRSVLERAGLFDLAYDRGQRADGDLGMRVHLSGAMMVLNPAIRVLHHHAAVGGLRMHKARVITYASSRQRLLHRQLLSATEIYLARRYFPPAQLREVFWLNILGTFSVRGGPMRKALKALISLVCLPHSLWVLRRRHRAAREMLERFPQIPRLARTPPSAPAADEPLAQALTP